MLTLLIWDARGSEQTSAAERVAEVVMKIETREDLEQAKAAISQDLHAASQIEWAESCEALLDKLDASGAEARQLREYITVGGVCISSAIHQLYDDACG